MKNLLSLVFLVGVTALLDGEEIEKLSMPLVSDLQRADLYILKVADHPAAILVLCPGFNGNGKAWIENPVWQKFASDNNLDLAGLSFASDGELLKRGRGYYYPSQGSGQVLLDGISNAVGGDLPLVLYGFSGGAHFSSGFADWKPERVTAWCAYSAEWWTPPSSNTASPPGLIICGDEDDRYGASLLYFKQGRAEGKPWLWISVHKNGHSIAPKVEDFVRHYFASVLQTNEEKGPGQWVDIDLKGHATEETLLHQPSLTAWLPDSKLLPDWETVHQP
jgi:pimeloyl-ACP methyl ester carboxylesterase